MQNQLFGEVFDLTHAMKKNGIFVDDNTAEGLAICNALGDALRVKYPAVWLSIGAREYIKAVDKKLRVKMNMDFKVIAAEWKATQPVQC